MHPYDKYLERQLSKYLDGGEEYSMRLEFEELEVTYYKHDEDKSDRGDPECKCERCVRYLELKKHYDDIERIDDERDCKND